MITGHLVRHLLHMSPNMKSFNLIFTITLHSEQTSMFVTLLYIRIRLTTVVYGRVTMSAIVQAIIVLLDVSADRRTLLQV